MSKKKTNKSSSRKNYIKNKQKINNQKIKQAHYLKRKKSKLQHNKQQDSNNNAAPQTIIPAIKGNGNPENGIVEGNSNPISVGKGLDQKRSHLRLTCSALYNEWLTLEDGAPFREAMDCLRMVLASDNERLTRAKVPAAKAILKVQDSIVKMAEVNEKCDRLDAGEATERVEGMIYTLKFNE